MNGKPFFYRIGQVKSSRSISAFLLAANLFFRL